MEEQVHASHILLKEEPSAITKSNIAEKAYDLFFANSVHSMTQVLRLLGKIHYVMGEFKLAIIKLEEAAALLEKNDIFNEIYQWILLDLAEIYLSQLNYDAADKFFDKLSAIFRNKKADKLCIIFPRSYCGRLFRTNSISCKNS